MILFIDSMTDGIEGIEEICASLGLGKIPMLNAENRSLFHDHYRVNADNRSHFHDHHRVLGPQRYG